MKKGNLRTRKVYPEKGVIKFCVEYRKSGFWKLVGDKSGPWIFDTENEATEKILQFFEMKNQIIEKLSNVLVDAKI